MITYPCKFKGFGWIFYLELDIIGTSGMWWTSEIEKKSPEPVLQIMLFSLLNQGGYTSLFYYYFFIHVSDREKHA